jgi:hypothetical protein
LLDPSRLDQVLQAFAKNTFTDNVTLADLTALADSLGNLDPATVTFYTLPTVPSPTVDGALDIDESRAPQIFAALINDQLIPSTPTAVSITATLPTPSTRVRRTSVTMPSTSTTAATHEMAAVNAAMATCV